MPQQNDDSVHHLHVVGWSSAGGGSDVGERTRRALPVAAAIWPGGRSSRGKEGNGSTAVVGT
jgi:hypothetical protein